MNIISTGSYIPEDIKTNSEITDTPEWVESKLGIKERHIAHMSSADMGFYAAMKATQNAAIAPRFIDMIIVATSTPPKAAPSTASIIQFHLGAFNAVCFDVNAVCSGFLYALVMAESFKKFHNILVIGTDKFSGITDWNHRNCVFFGDGAGAVLVRQSSDPLYYKLGTDSRNNGFSCDIGGTFEMDGKKVYTAGTRYLPKVINETLKKAGLTIDDIDYLIPHQASMNMLKTLAQLIKLPFEKVKTNMDKYGNTAAASIPILLDENIFNRGDKLLLASIGSGWTYGAMIIEW